MDPVMSIIVHRRTPPVGYVRRSRHAAVTRSLPGILVLIAGCVPSVPPAPVPADAKTLTLQRIAFGFVSPVALTAPNDGSGRLFVVDQIGLIRIVTATGEVLPEPLLDLRPLIDPLHAAYDERGLLGMALHPNFAVNGRFFLLFNTLPSSDAPAGTATELRLSEFQVVTAALDVSRLDTQRVLLRIAKPQTNNNGGQLAFGTDGYLYIGLGDGGGLGDVGFGHTPVLGNAQDTTTLLGKILRINVDAGDPYTIPLDNPFANAGPARPEIYAYGLHNPWRFSFDPVPGGTTRLFAGDVGQELDEEVDLVTIGGNYGWNIREGALCFDPDAPTRPPATCPDQGADGSVLSPPILDYRHTDAAGLPFGSAVIGGFCYRGAGVPTLQGTYVFGDFSAGSGTGGKILTADQAADGTWSFAEARIAGTADGRIGRSVLSFGRDADGELYVLTKAGAGLLGTTGEVFKIVGFE